MKKRAMSTIATVLLLVFALSPISAFADSGEASWVPTEDVNLIVPFGAGGSTDLIARTFANNGTDCFATPVVVQNIPGGGCAIGYTELINAEPDGLTICNAGISVIVNTMTSETPYVYYEEMQPLCQVGYSTYGVYVKGDSEIETLDDLRDALLDHDVVQATVNRGGNTHWELEYFAMKNGSDITSVVYDSGAAAIAAVLGGHADVSVQSLVDGSEYVRSGELKAIAVLSDSRIENEVYKDIPTSTEQGYDYLQDGFFCGYCAPLGVSDEVIKYYEDAFKACLEVPEIQEAMADYGFEIVYQDHEEFMQTWMDTKEKYATVFEELGDRLSE